MKTEPIVAAQIEFVEGQPPRSTQFDEFYHPHGGAWTQAQDVVLAGNDLPARWAARRRFVIVETGFGLGFNFLATWQAWKEDTLRCGQLTYVSVEKHPPTRQDLQRAHAEVHAHANACAGGPQPALANELADAWPPLASGVHTLDFEGGAVRLMLALGDAQHLLPALQLQADTFYLDGFSPARNPSMWNRRLVNAMARMAAPNATAATWNTAPELRAHLHAAGFETNSASSNNGQQEITRARFAPPFLPRRSPARASALEIAVEAANTPRTALIIGAGLAGASTAAALARMGWRCTVLDGHSQPAQGASGNPAGLFHGTVHAVDGAHARFTRAAALYAASCYRRLIDEGRVTGAAEGLLRANADPLPTHVPADYARSLQGQELPVWANTPANKETAVFYPGGGWIAPAELVNHWLYQPGVSFHGDRPVHQIQRSGPQWQAFSTDGRMLAEASVLVLACGAAALPSCAQIGAIPMRAQRGQITWFESDIAPPLPMSGHGYALGLPGRQLLCGATANWDDDDPTIRGADHLQNLERLKSLAQLAPASGQSLHGRVSWRAMTRDRLPAIGAVPMRRADIEPGARLDQARMVPRVPGLFVLGGLASRGLTWAPLAAEVLAAWIDGAPLPLESDLLDAVDPARWLVRAARAQTREISR